jgi:lipopolysaccharide transport protein LptA
MTKWLRHIPALLALLSLLAGSAGAQTGSNTVITADEMTFDYKGSVATFLGNVKVVDPQLRLDADKVTVTFEGTNAVKAVTATGNVRLSQVDKTATCHKAVYLARDGEVRLTGNVVVRRQNDSLSGPEIIFWVNEDRMQCPGRSTLVISPQGRETPIKGLRSGSGGH